MNNTEKIIKPKGQISMVLHKGGEYDKETGKIVGGEIIAEKEVKNLIVDKASELMACRLAPGASTGAVVIDPNTGQIINNPNSGTFPDGVDGLQYLAVGVGILVNPTLPYDKVTNPVDTVSWNLQDPPEETLNTTKLQGEIFRKEFTSWTFVKPDGADSATPTNTLKLVTTFTESEAVGPLTEMGLFGGNATATKNSGYMFNYKTFPVWNKPLDTRLTVTWKLTF